MAEITASAVKALREKTGAGMMECKAALTEANGNEEQAIEILRKKGAATADKKASRVTAEGVVGSYMPEFDLDNLNEDYFMSQEWSGIIGKWQGYVRAVVEKKGNPPQLY